jgi:5-enolpyruvylshikimate-3-phosphate synthase
MERSCSFDATGDHRLVMAGAVAQWAGFPINMSGVDAVHKSFPEFLTIAKLV